jgi:hypothetical protein
MSNLNKAHFVSLLALFIFMQGCQEDKKSSSSSSSNVDFSGSTSGGSSGGTTTGSSTGGTGGVTTGGVTTGGPSANVYMFKAIMAGGSNWSIGVVPSDLGSDKGDFVALTASNRGIFASDSRYKVKVKVLDPSSEGIVITTNNSGIRTCYGRLFPRSQQPTYTKLSFQVGIRDIYESGGAYSLGTTYGRKSITMLPIDQYAPVLNWSLGQNPGRNSGPNIVGHAIVVENIQSDSSCQWFGGASTTYCPMSAHPTTACWGVQVELATDLTSDF